MPSRPPNIFASLPEDLQEESFLTLAAGQGMRIERIVSRGHSSPAEGWYEQADDEWVMVVQGEAELRFGDGRSLQMRAGDHLHIPAMQKHRVAWTAPDQDTIWLAVHFSPSN
jgi:cupin 2 domain-containing protein